MPITRPVNLHKPFADAGGRSVIPVDSQIGVPEGAGRASYTDGFPPVTRTPIAAGGIPPKGLDMNGILYDLSSHVVFQNAGGQYRFDADLADQIGGYSIGTILQSDDGLASYMSIVDGNTDDFNSNPAVIGTSWLLVGMPRATTAQAQGLTNDDSALTPKKLDDAFKGSAQSLAENGYQRQPGGLIKQWGVGLTNASGLVTVTFPIAFPTMLARLLTDSAGTPGGPYVPSGLVSSGQTGFSKNMSISSSGSAAPAGISMGYHAIGF